MKCVMIQIVDNPLSVAMHPKVFVFLYRTVAVTVVVVGIVSCTQPQSPCNACVYIYHITSSKASIHMTTDAHTLAASA